MYKYKEISASGKDKGIGMRFTFPFVTVFKIYKIVFWKILVMTEQRTVIPEGWNEINSMSWKIILSPGRPGDQGQWSSQDRDEEKRDSQSENSGHL